MMMIKNGSFQRDRMNRIVPFLILASTLLLFAPRLPAPISEIATPAPAEVAKPTTKPKANTTSTENSSRQQKIALSPFAGTWVGTYIGQYHCSDGSEGVTKDSGQTAFTAVS